MSATNTFYRKIRKRGSLSLPALFFLFLFFTATAFAESPEKCHAWIPVFRGVDYLFLHQETPLPQRIHLVKIDLKDPAIRFTSTPPNTEKARRETRCETTLAFVKEKKAQLGINGNFLSMIIRKTRICWDLLYQMEPSFHCGIKAGQNMPLILRKTTRSLL